MDDDRLIKLEQELDAIKQRNARVESDKAWEVSAFRLATIAAITYVVATILLFVIDADRPWLGALVPMVGFILSAQSLPAVKQWWIKKKFRG